ncbi:hypothetical protein PsorP6_004499 [Peronosclerospora sorghi]|uniref:Uncharacterized protein n=1 Tax=Peronosclerospora sorghi TaxID=230839 RepID=A0ACC0VJP1_9STRA|nr:hypothetical protein PsorP6_004499 [Peronosclerospora sorghi]
MMASDRLGYLHHSFFRQFPSDKYALDDAVTLGELNGELYSVSSKDSVRISDDFIRRGGRAFNPARVASIKPPPFGQRESLTDEQDEELDSGALKLLKRIIKIAKSILLDEELIVLNWAFRVAGGATQRLLKPVMGTADEELEPLKSQDQGNGESIVDISWHPMRNVLAVAQLDGVVTLYHVESTSWDIRVLEHTNQIDIGSIQWGKYTGDTLAVACRTGVFLWKVPMNGGEPVLKEILKHPDKSGLSQLCWNEDGSLLAVCGKGSRSLVVFDTIFSRKTELQSPYNLVSLHWSPTGEYLFSNCVLSLFNDLLFGADAFYLVRNGVSLMWETLTWKRETWDVATGGCGWSSNGRCLLVALRDSPTLYPYIFQDPPPSLDAHISSPALDFTEKELFSADRSTSAVTPFTQKLLSSHAHLSIVGGSIQSIAWDPSGSRVAVTYQTTANGSNQARTAALVAIFSVVWLPFLIFTPSGLLRGPPNAGVPRKLAFASNFKHGALLSVVWSSGLISFHPFYLRDPKAF